MKRLLITAALCSVVFSVPVEVAPEGPGCPEGECLKGKGLPGNLPFGLPDDIGEDIVGEPLTIDDFKQELIAHDEPEPVDDNWIALAGAFEGDIILEDAEQLNQLNESAVSGTQNNAIISRHKVWSNGVIPYVISNSYNAYERGQIAAAMAHYHSTTCIKFVPRSTHRNYIHIYRGSGCSSMVGRQGGRQVVSLGTGCASKGVVLHELMHAAGFWHEQSRWDRDSYVRVNWGNIIRGTEYNFQKYNWNTIQHLGQPYDLNSIMHYGSKAFTRDYRYTTIDALRGSIGRGTQRANFSPIDMNKLNKLYKCGGITTGRGDCEDQSPFCSDWQKKGECTKNPAYMDDNCKKACGKCKKGNACEDKNEFCADWKRKGECTKNAAFMNESCKKSCGKCGTTTSNNCVDDNEFCGDWQRKGECTRNAEFMNKSCKKSCNACSTVTTTTAAPTTTPTEGTTTPNNCKDDNQFCSDWATKGECTRNAEFMNLSCKKSCNSCSSTTTTTTTEKATTTTTLATTTKAATTTTSGSICEDKNQYCSDWATKGDCKTNAGYMLLTCRKSCKVCTGPTTTETTTEAITEAPTTVGSICEDKNQYCSDWATKGDCETNAGYMLLSCRKSCKLCTGPTTTETTTDESTEAITEAPTTDETTTDESTEAITEEPTTDGSVCEDTNQYCSDWAAKGDCETNAGYMLLSCRKSCDSC